MDLWLATSSKRGEKGFQIDLYHIFSSYKERKKMIIIDEEKTELWSIVSTHRIKQVSYIIARVGDKEEHNETLFERNVLYSSSNFPYGNPNLSHTRNETFSFQKYQRIFNIRDPIFLHKTFNIRTSLLQYKWKKKPPLVTNKEFSNLRIPHRRFM